MITEDYCSAKVAKLLQEKGFTEPVTELNRLLFKEGEKPVLKITHQKAMKWLRENFNINPVPYALSLGWAFDIFDLSNRDITGCKKLFSMDLPSKSECYKSYEEACEAAIKYCLDNLI